MRVFAHRALVCGTAFVFRDQRALTFACRELIPDLLGLPNKLVDLRVAILFRPGQDELPLSFSLHFKLEPLLLHLLL